MSSLPYDIVLLPGGELADKAIRTSKELEPLDTLFTLGSERYLPHVSLYMTQLRDEDLPNVFEKLADIAARAGRLALEAKGYAQAEGYIDADYAETSAIVDLQRAVIAAINPIRDGMRAKDKARMQAATGLARENLEKYGYRGVGELFRPHLTFTRFANRLPIPLEDMGAPTAFSGTYTSLAICQMGPNGTCLNKVMEFKLQ